MPPAAALGIGAAVGGISTIAGSLIAQGTAEGAQQQALAATQQAVSIINSVGAPPDLARQIFLDQYKQAGILSPTMEQTINTQFNKIAPTSPDVVKAQTDALSKLSQDSSQGITAQDRLALNQLQTSTARQNQAQQQQIVQNMAARGQGTSGAELAARLQSQQGNANQAAQGGLQIAANAQQRALQALQAQAGQANTMQQQQFQQNSANANIQNEQNRFNTQNQLAVQQQNVANQNNAQAANLQNAQNISNANVGQANAEQIREVQAQQQMYNDAMAHAQAQANAYTGQGQQIANFGQQNAASQAGMFGGIANIAAGLGTGLSNAYNSSQLSNAISGLGSNGNGIDYSNYSSNPTAYGSSAGTSGPYALGYNSAYTPSNYYGPTQFAHGGMVPSQSDMCNGGMTGYWQGGPTLRNTGDMGTSDNVPQTDSGYQSQGPNEYYSGGFLGATDAPGYATGGYMNMKSGGGVPGKEVVPGDSPKNDTVDAKLSPGEFVIPKSIVQHNAEIVKKLMALMHHGAK